jgi:hypothetical protein
VKTPAGAARRYPTCVPILAAGRNGAVRHGPCRLRMLDRRSGSADSCSHCLGSWRACAVMALFQTGLIAGLLFSLAVLLVALRAGRASRRRRYLPGKETPGLSSTAADFCFTSTASSPALRNSAICVSTSGAPERVRSPARHRERVPLRAPGDVALCSPSDLVARQRPPARWQRGRRSSRQLRAESVHLFTQEPTFCMGGKIGRKLRRAGSAIPAP